MGCGGSKDGKSNGDGPGRTDPNGAPTAMETEVNQKKMQQCVEIVDTLDTSKDGILQPEELQLLVKHLYPCFINVCVKDIPLDNPKIKAFDQKNKEELAKYLYAECDETWVSVFHGFLGRGEKKSDFPKCEPGVYRVKWEGGVRYRLTPNYTDIADEEHLALPDTEFDISHFVQGPMGLWYGYIHWAKYFLPMTFQDGNCMMERIGEPGTSKQLRRLAEDLFHEIDSMTTDGYADWQEITSFLQGAEIAFDEEALKIHFEACDLNADNKLDLEEFVECYRQEAMANVFAIPTATRMDIPHPESLKDDIQEQRRERLEKAKAKLAAAIQARK